MSTTTENLASMDGKFCLCRADGPFEADPFRDWPIARDFGLVEATNGAYGGQITRAKELGRTTGPHWHPMTFQMIYVLKGWVKFWYEREGELMLKAGDFVYHPPRAAHDLLEYRTDCTQMAPP